MDAELNEMEKLCQFWWRKPPEYPKLLLEPRLKMEKDKLSTQVKDGLQHVRNGYTVLHFNYQGLSELPTDLFTNPDFRHIKRIHLKRNRLKILPDAIGTLVNLTELYLHSNDLESLPDNIGKLAQLQSLDLSNNNLSELPTTITELCSLSVLAISNNNIHTLPTGMDKMRQLTILDLMNNQLQFLPQEVIKCPNLQRLLLDRNKLTWLPKQLCHMTHLEELSVAGNNLLTLPLDLGHIRSLKTVYVDNNKCLHAIPISIQNQEIGFNSCGTQNFDRTLQNRRAPLSVTITHDGGVKVICLPAELVHIGNKQDSVPSLLELATRQVFKHKHKLRTTDLPRNLEYYLQGSTASCCACQDPIFTSGFPLVFEGQVRLYSLHYLGLCCSMRCSRMANLLIQLPLVYPDPADLDMAVALVQ